ncbi:hypothetical protein Ddc_20317 [Ditylenchus destructor]|nr:hypothetical protein Ddc_20317 [Ditylenchus destructor]
MDVLKPINHLSELGAVRIKRENIPRSPGFADLFTACRQLALEFDGSLSLFSSLSHVKCRDMLIKDPAFNTASGLPRFLDTPDPSFSISCKYISEIGNGPKRKTSL